MGLNKLALVLGLAGCALPLPAVAQAATAAASLATQGEAALVPAVADAPAVEEAPTSNWSWNLSVTSDYVLRGITLSNFKPALQGGLDYAFGVSGFYIGAWGTSVDLADPVGPDIELDGYIGYSTDVSDDWHIDLRLTRYAYLGQGDVYGDIDFNEYQVSTTYRGMLTFMLAHAPDFLNLGYWGVYYNVAGTWDLGHGFSLNAGVGHAKFGGNNASRNDWNLGVSRQFGPVNASIDYHDTSIPGARASDAVVLTLALGG